MQETGGDWTGTGNRAKGREVDWELRRGEIREERVTGKSALQATGEVGEGGIRLLALGRGPAREGAGGAGGSTGLGRERMEVQGGAR